MNTVTTKTPVLIVGAGPTGLTMAAELTRHGIPCRIIDYWSDFGEAPHAGDRAPDFTFSSNGEESRLFEIIQGTSHKLLLFVGNYDEPDFERDFKQRYSLVKQKYGEAIEPVLIHMNELPFEVDRQILVVQDDNGELHQRYGAHSHCIYLIRPDGYIGYRSQPAKLDLFLEYCDRIFARTAIVNV